MVDCTLTCCELLAKATRALIVFNQSVPCLEHFLRPSCRSTQATLSSWAIDFSLDVALPQPSIVAFYSVYFPGKDTRKCKATQVNADYKVLSISAVVFGEVAFVLPQVDVLPEKPAHGVNDYPNLFGTSSRIRPRPISRNVRQDA